MAEPTVPDAALNAALDAYDQDVADFSQRSEHGIRAALAAAYRVLADAVDRGPAIPLPPSVYSALIREYAADLTTASRG